MIDTLRSWADKAKLAAAIVKGISAVVRLIKALWSLKDIEDADERQKVALAAFTEFIRAMPWDIIELLKKILQKENENEETN